MKGKAVLLTAIIVVLLSCLFLGCGVSQEEYDRVNAQLIASQSQATELQRQIDELKEKYELVGETPAETAQKIVKQYHATHIYSEYDFFVCSDMALDVWDMLKAQGINAIIQIGNVKTEAKVITDADHAWILAEVSPGEYLALETTGGYAVWEEDNSLYYEGWQFNNPREYKRFVELKQEYNMRVSVIDQLTNKAQKTYEEYQELANEFNRRYVGRPVSLESQAQLSIVKEKEGRYNQLTELISSELQELENIVSEMKGLFI